ncbi:DUF3558 domain-containing protein [Antrihabitans sp. YC2-6]|uniref:DUF3558 domain-containing protein n=1 Tax=Antrihabitans sp. YC2-6 TaxID=2799498 RepID=UPI0018F4410A|nr:DUF3558 domain-containing protein [Antrihabitans sp. YC2-6]MBJ8346364.1 DUF3558 domain-containing protein [Antrihabitans sp. YC2-6]
MNRKFITIAFAGAALCACGTGQSESSVKDASSQVNSTSVRVTLTAEELQPPKQDNDPRYEDVVYDPCTFVEDQAVINAGFDPSTRRRIDGAAEWTNLGCHFDSVDGGMLLISGNVKFEDQRERFADKRVSNELVNGRDAFIYREPGDPRTCSLDMRTKVGSALVAVTVDVGSNVNPCDGLVRVAQIIEPSIGAEN